MPEPVTPAVATMAAAPPAVAMITAFGINLGLRPDVLVAGFAGALVAIVLLGSVPADGDTWRQLLRTTWRRMWVSVASSLTAGYLTPAVLLVADPPAPVFLACAMTVGAGAERILRRAIERYDPATTKAAASPPPPGGPGAGGAP